MEIKLEDSENQTITPFEVKCSDKINYHKLIKDFGCSSIDSNLKYSIKNSLPTGSQISHLLSRDIYYAHRDLDSIFPTLPSTPSSNIDSLDIQTSTKIFDSYLYTGRGPSTESMHLGHTIPFLMNLYLQKTFNLPLLIMLSDDEKYLSKSLSLDEIKKCTLENAKDILAFGFDINKTFLFSNFDTMGTLYPSVCSISRHFKLNTLKSVFGFSNDSNIGLCHYTAIQAAPCFSSTFPMVLGPNKKRCIIPCAIDQDPYFRVCRDIAPKIKEMKPVSMYAKFLPPLEGRGGKMSSSSDAKGSCIFLNDSEKEIRNKIKKYAFSGALKTMEEHKKHGANLETDISCEYLRFFMKDDAKLEDVLEEYSKGRIGTGAVKKTLGDELMGFLEEYQRRRRGITDAEVEEFMRMRKLG